MKLRCIILIRHGESHANKYESKFSTEPDYTIELTVNGNEQSRQAGLASKELLGNESVYFYISPSWRIRSIFENIARSFSRIQFSYRDEQRKLDQERGYLRIYGELKRLKVDRPSMETSAIVPRTAKPARKYILYQQPAGHASSRFPRQGLFPQLRADYPFVDHLALCHAVVLYDGRGVQCDALTRELRIDDS